MTENIIKFIPKNNIDESQKRGIKKEEFNYCRHPSKLANTVMQHLECADCGQVITAWDYILEICKDEQRLFDHLKYAKEERNRLDSELIDIKRQVKNAKSQLKRANNLN